MARNTAHARLDRLHRLGVLGRNERSVDLHALGFGVAAVVSLSIRHAEVEQTVAALEQNPRVAYRVSPTLGRLLPAD